MGMFMFMFIGVEQQFGKQEGVYICEYGEVQLEGWVGLVLFGFEGLVGGRIRKFGVFNVGCVG